MKQCAKCKEEKSDDGFNKNPRMTSGLTSYCRLCMNAGLRAAYAKRKYDPRAHANAHLRRYNITVDDYERMEQEQQGVCDICHLPQVGRMRLCVDHDHETDDVRSLLCINCNAALGLLKDCPDRMRSAARYIEKHNAK